MARAGYCHWCGDSFGQHLTSLVPTGGMCLDLNCNCMKFVPKPDAA